MTELSKVLELSFRTGRATTMEVCARRAKAARDNYMEAIKVARDAADTGNWALANEMYTFADRFQREATGYHLAYNWNRDSK